MDRRRSRWTVIAITAVVLTACGSQEPRPISSPGVIQGERVSTDNALPAEFPSDFPLPGQRTVLYSAVSSVGVVAYFTSETKGEALKAVLLAGLRDKGWALRTCLTQEGGTEPVTTIVASKGRTVATALVGYSPQAAGRIQGRVYTFFVSIALDADAPPGDAEPC